LWRPAQCAWLAARSLLIFNPAEFPPCAADSVRVEPKLSATANATQVEQHSSDDISSKKVFHDIQFSTWLSFSLPATNRQNTRRQEAGVSCVLTTMQRLEKPAKQMSSILMTC
jgi:macrodomain Ter protein organizer (MatP/YcbG family)